jgi:UDP-glucose 4-epimerase
MRALVTGGAGFIGSNLVDALLDRHDEVSVIDDLSTGKRANLDCAVSRGADFHEVDLRDAARVRSVVAGARPDIVFHLAAQADVRKSIEDPAWDASINVLGTINVLEASRLAGVRRVVNTSTGGAIYGDTDVMPTPESVDPKPMSAYGQSKFCAEAYCGWYERLHGLSSVVLRYGNVYGPRQDPHGEAGVVAIFCGRLLDGKPCTIYGDGKQTRDYVFAGDVARANLFAAEKRFDGPLNVGTGVETDVVQLYQHLARAAGVSRPPEHAAARLGEQKRSCIDPSAAAKAIGWRPEVGLADGLARTFEWFKARR